MNSLYDSVSALLADKALPGEVVLENVLHRVLQEFHSETGTIHTLNAETQLLHLAAQIGLPPQILNIVKTIPVGKGIAGQVAAENRPVTICNLQTDASGVAKPGAKQTGVGGALCVPIRRQDKILGTFGIGTLREHEYSAAEINSMQEIADLMGTNEALKHG